MLLTLSGEEARPLIPRAVAVYREAFGAPPYGEGGEEADLFGRVFALEVDEPGFVCCALHDGTRGGDEWAGFCYGYEASDGEPSSAWCRRLLAAVGPRQVDLVLGQFVLAWFAVRPDQQGRGLGGRLHDAVLARTTRPHAWLVTHDLPTTARRFYAHRGWRRIGAGPLGWNGERRLVLGLDRTAR